MEIYQNQDHVDPNLLFLATEYGIYFSQNGGGKWVKLKGSPTISFRDLAIQKRENDLVGASFGRSFFVLDDYSPLRSISTKSLTEKAAIYPIADADWYVPRSIIGSEGHQHYAAPNPEFGAVITYHVNKEYKTLKGQRKEAEKKMNKAKQNVKFPGWDALDAEKNEEKAKVWLVIADSDGEIIRKIKANTSKGIHRTAWDLRYSGDNTIRPGRSADNISPWMRRWMRGPLVAPGQYSVSLVEEVNGEATTLAGPQSVNVVPLRKGTLESGGDPAVYAAFMKRLRALRSSMSSVQHEVDQGMKVTKAMLTALDRTTVAPGSQLGKDIRSAMSELRTLSTALNGNSSKEEIGERNNTSIGGRFFNALIGLSSTYGPTTLNESNLSIAESELPGLKVESDRLSKEVIPSLIMRLKDVGAPYIQGY